MNAPLFSHTSNEQQKCSTEQFWAVATFIGLNGFLLARDLTFKSISPHWIAILDIFLDLWAIVYILSRAKAYAQLNKRLENILGEKDPNQGVTSIKIKCADILNGAGLYMCVIILTCIAVVIKYWADT